MLNKLLKMNRIISISVIVFFSISCQQEASRASQFSLEVTLSNIPSNTNLYISYPQKVNGTWRECEQTMQKGAFGTFYISGEISGIVPAIIWSNPNDAITIFIDTHKMDLFADYTTLYDYSLNGTSISNEIDAFRTTFYQFEKTTYEMRQEIFYKNEELNTLLNINSDNSYECMLELNEKVMTYKDYCTKYQELCINFINRYPTSKITPYFISELARSDYDASIVATLYDHLSTEQKNSILGEFAKINIELYQSNCNVGEYAIDWELNSITGETLQLSDYYNKGYVLLDFWASWCRPCLKSIPDVKKLCDDHGTTLQIIGISLDEDLSKWEAAINDNAMNFCPQVICTLPEDADSYYFKKNIDISAAYNVSQIPCYILIDPSGYIVGRWSQLNNETINNIVELLPY